jgi:hypothetical protein
MVPVVICEKPLADTLSAARKIIALGGAKLTQAAGTAWLEGELSAR